MGQHMSLEHELTELVALVQYLDEAPEGLREALYKDEEALRQKRVNTEVQHPFPLIELRWLKYHLELALQPQLISSTKHETMLRDRMQNYVDSIVMCSSLIKRFTQENASIQANPDALEAKIKEQQERIFQHYLNKAIEQYLLTGGKLLSSDPQSTTEKILAQALASYKEAMDRETLYFFETKNLIERHGLLEEKKEAGKRNLVIEHHTLTFETDPELRFIKSKLKKEGSDLFYFKLQGTTLLFNNLEYPSYSTSLELNQRLDDFFKEHGDQNIDPDILTLEDSNIHLRKIRLYFASESICTVRDELNKALKNFLAFKATLQLPNPSIEPIVLKTEDKKLQSLRDIVTKYRNVLDNIEQEEKTTYTERSEEQLKHRRQALCTLEQRIGKETTLTPEMRSQVKMLVDEIIVNKPHWKELPLIDKILDIISLGLHALIRHSQFKAFKEVRSLEELSQVTPKKEDDQEDKDADNIDSVPP